MQTKRPKQTKLTSPFGTAGFCNLLRPSTKFNPDGDYNAKVILPEGPDTDKLIADLEALYEAAYAENLRQAQVDKPKLTEIKRADKPYHRPQDPDTGEALPGWVINPKLKAVRRDKDKKVVGTAKPIILDSTGQKPVVSDIGSGSTIRVQFMAGGFYTAALGSGLSLKLVGVQVKELVPVGSAKAEFDAVEGFVETAEPIADSVNMPTATTTDQPVADDGQGEW